MRERNPDVPADLERIVGRLLEKDRELRYSSAAELREDLRRLQAGSVPMAVRVRTLPLKYGIAAAGALVLAAGGFFTWQQRTQAKPLTDKDVLVLADFANSTGDPVFDGTLRQGLAIQLEQSPFLKIMDDDQVQRKLRLMNLPPSTPITSQIAHEICERDGAAAATIGGSIASLGKSYVVTLQATACQGGATIARQQTPAEDKEHVLSALGAAATAMRAKLGESRGSVQKLNVPLEQVTTPSLEALRSYTEGKDELSHGRFLSGVPHLQRALTLDPNFAMAYYYLSVAFGNAGDKAREAEYERKAFALIDRVSEFERDNIAGGYYESTDELDKALDFGRLGIANYPRVWSFPNNLANIQISLGKFEDGLREGQAASDLEPNAEPPWRRQLDALICLDRVEEAARLAEKVRSRGIDGARIHQRFLELAYVKGDQAGADREIQWYAGKPVEYLSLGLQAAWRNVLGRRNDSAKLYRRAAETAMRQGLRDVAAGFEEADARADALSGNCRTARRLGRPADALALCGDEARAEKLAAETSKVFPNGTIWNGVQLPEIRAALALHRGDPANAVEVLASATSYERAYPEPVYLRGLAYLRLHKGAEAVAEFRKIVDHEGASWAATWPYPNQGLYYSISWLGLGRAYEIAGDSANARKAFDEFFALWKDADRDISLLVEAGRDRALLH